MSYVSSEDRNQMRLFHLEELVRQDSTARVIDAFIDSVDIPKLGFLIKGKSAEGRPAYSATILSKLYLYGYLNSLRSGRKLEEACKINVELWWLLHNQKPGYKTITDFRKNNEVGFRNLFNQFRSFCLAMNLYGKKVVAIDGSKFRGQNSMKNNYNRRKIDKQFDYLTEQYVDYMKELDRNDEYDSDDKVFNNLNKRMAKYENLDDQLNATEETQISTTDPDARALPLHMNIVQVGYNLQSAVDSKHKLIAEFDVTNKNDHRALAPMAIKTKAALNLNKGDRLTVLADKGYHTGEQLQTCHDNNISTLVAKPRRRQSKNDTKPDYLSKDNFDYDEDSNTYTCPEGHVMQHQNRYTRKKKGKSTGAPFDRYKMDWETCSACVHFERCVSKGNRSRKQGRYIDRYLTDKAVQKNQRMVNRRRALYKTRQELVEHPFGTIKRQWGYDHTLMKTIPKVTTEFSIITLSYNIRRVMSILGVNALIEALKTSNIEVLVLSAHMKRLTFGIVYSFCGSVPRLTQLRAK